MDQRALFPLPPANTAALPAPTRPEHTRVVRADRAQVQWVTRDLDATLPLEHPARAIWEYLEGRDLSAFYGSIRAVLDGPGRPATDPQVLLALWLLATAEGVGSARQLAELCETHDAYRWICGGVPINHHMLSDFRRGQQAALDKLLTEIIASLMAAGAVTLERVAQDGMRVRASAGAASYRRRETLEMCRQAARKQVERLGADSDDTEVSKRLQAARERAVRERQARVERALACLPELDRTKQTQRHRYTKDKRVKVREARASTTDPDARIMKMPDGGFRPAYNVQFATDSEQGVIVGVAVTNAGTDAREARRSSNRSSVAPANRRDNTSSMAASRHATRSPRWRRPASRCTPPCDCHGTSLTPPATNLAGATARKSRHGVRGWRVVRPR